MGFKSPKAFKTNNVRLEESGERDCDPTKSFTGGRKVSKKRMKNRTTSDAPKSFQFVMNFMEMKQQKDANAKKAKEAQEKRQRKQKEPVNAGKPQAVTETLKIMPGESMVEFNRRVRQKMENNLQLIGTDFEAKEKSSLNPSRDEGEQSVVSKRTDRKRRNDAIRKERKQAKKHRDDDETYESHTTAEAPRFGEQAQAPPVFKTLPKERIKKMVPLPNSKEEAEDIKQRDNLAVKKMIQRTARLTPLERMQAKRKAKELGDTAAEKRIIELERERAIRRYRMLRETRESAKK
ncbi:hypothetical protein IW139_002678 [Coemansia sp. RSA 353]|nr:hypothetical protein GGF48_001305 [Coemansia sp. RSA 921]KAJ2182135.1 hypothetical protein GGF45_001069 [Coemansia sp. RSA 551]KAJ2197267.1 hypothetical protein IW144_002511 [Coemansia sp. RSA 522]KAJ2208071.1 hypothetical protein IW145_001014 [Coemansia sp. RSA 521]KAJ2229022.1 hypothetical protein EV180_001698 [Coemansia sp. RSA 518]KAJ2242440.1 hypothetical protein GGH97_003922 [Coemansia sp. RSA 475]KAJ2277208.1 hypothetical protein J3F81_001045 [Coemansia sp. RSA 371]KAJ2280710.1 hyp